MATKTIEVTRCRMDTRRFDVLVGGRFRGFILRNKAEALWVAYGTGGIKDLLGQSRARKACVEMIERS